MSLFKLSKKILRWEEWQNRGWSAYCTGSASRPSVQFLSFSFPIDLSSSDREGHPTRCTPWRRKLVLMSVLIMELSVTFSRAPHWQVALLCYQVVEENSLALLVPFTVLATPTDIQATENASGTFTQRLVAASNSPLRNLTLNITQTATMMFWR